MIAAPARDPSCWKGGVLSGLKTVDVRVWADLGSDVQPSSCRDRPHWLGVEVCCSTPCCPSRGLGAAVSQIEWHEVSCLSNCGVRAYSRPVTEAATPTT